MKIKLLALTLLVVATSQVALAQAGGNTGGGGDPMVQEFIIEGRQLAAFFKQNPYKSVLPFDAAKFADTIKAVDTSVKKENVKDLLEFTDKVLRNSQGNQKAALFDRRTGMVRVNRAVWRGYEKTPEERLILITMEISGLIADSGVRYEAARELVHNHAAVILSIPLDVAGGGGNSNAYKGMRIVGQDPGQFDRITDLDVIIDGGVVGLDPVAGLRVENFYKDPQLDPEWWALLQKAWAQDRPAYFLLTDPNGNRAVVSSIIRGKNREGDGGVAAYSFLFSKYAQIYEGPCMGTARSLSPRERLLNCYLNADKYGARDTSSNELFVPDETPASIAAAVRKLGADIGGSVFAHFALDDDVVQQALRANYIVNYSVGLGWYAGLVPAQSLLANGIFPSWSGPFAGAPFWARSQKKNPSAIRLYQAVKTLAQMELGFLDNTTRCESDVIPKNRKDDMIVPLALLRKYKADENKCETMLVNKTFTTSLYGAMVEYGFLYDYKAETWKLKFAASRSH